MSLKSYNARVKATQSIFDEYYSKELKPNVIDMAVIIDSLRQKLNLETIFDNFDRNDALATRLSSLEEISPKRAIVGDVCEISDGDNSAIGILIDHYRSLSLCAGNVFGIVSNKNISRAWRIGGDE